MAGARETAAAATAVAEEEEDRMEKVTGEKGEDSWAGKVAENTA